MLKLLLRSRFTSSVPRKRLRNFRCCSTNANNSSPTHILIKNGVVVNADREFPADVLIGHGKIMAVVERKCTDDSVDLLSSQLKSTESVETIDASGKYVIPGGIDPHVHLEMPFMGTTSADDYLAGTRAAVAGGTTCLVDFIIPKKGEELIDAYNTWAARGIGKACCDYSFHCGITYWDDEKTPRGMKQLVQEKGIPSFKVFLAYKGSLMVSDQECVNVLETAKELGAVTMAHCENGELVSRGVTKVEQAGVLGPEGHYLSRPDIVEAEATHRMIAMAQFVNTPLYVVHVMSALAADEVARGRRSGAVVFGETLASTLGVDGTKLLDPDWRTAAGYVMSPPLNPDPRTKEIIMQRLAAGELQVVSTDNCTFRSDQKMLGKDNFKAIPNGINGIEDRLSIVWNNGVCAGLLSRSDFVRVTSTQASQIFNMYPQKGVIQVGSDADVVIWDGDSSRTVSRHTHHHAVDFNIFEGQQLQGVAETTISNGVIKWRRGISTNATIEEHKGSGRLITRAARGYAFSRIDALDQHNDPSKHRVDRAVAAGSAASNNISVNKASMSVSPTATAPTPAATQLGVDDVAAVPTDTNTAPITKNSNGEFTSLEAALMKHLPEAGGVRAEALRILYGSTAADMTSDTDSCRGAVEMATKHGFELGGVYRLMGAESEQLRCEPRRVRIAAIQNSIAASTSLPIAEQKAAMFDKIRILIEAAAVGGANIVCLQECWTSPFFMCTRERYPWVEFAEDPRSGESTVFLKELAKRHNMVILSPILEKDRRQGVLHNSCVVISNHGEFMGLHRKNHIPRVGDFNESSYYLEGDTGHNVFETDFGRIGVNICYGRHHPLNWTAFGLMGAEIVFNPSATVGALSEPLWGIEARCAAIANSYFTVAINRVGTETFPHAFTSGDGKPAHTDFGHFYGSSYVTSPTGQRTPGLSRTQDGVLLTDVDLRLCDQMKQKWQFPLTQRLPMYADLLAEFSSPDNGPN